MRRVVAFLLLFAVGMLIYGIGGYYPIDPAWRALIKTLLPVVLLVIWLLCRFVKRLQPWSDLALGLLAGSTAFLVARWLSEPLLALTGASLQTVRGVALAKLSDAITICAAVLVVSLGGGRRLGDLYLQRGRWRTWLIVGLGAFAAFFAFFLWQSTQQGATGARLLAALPWVLVFVLANSFMEELHFRGLLLRPFAEQLGPHAANLCIALFFTLIHAPVQYTPDIITFLMTVFPLALIWGYLIQRSDSLWGAVLFHAGADLVIMAGIVNQYAPG